MPKEKKKFKDTKFGQWLSEKAPDIISITGDLLPDKGVLGIVKNMIERSEMSAEDKAAANNFLKEIYQLEVQDRESARRRQADVAQAGGNDILFNITGGVGLLIFCFIVYAIVFLHVPEDNKELWIHLIGICEGVVLSIFGYYFGSAMKRNVQ
jgi:hypothetical protein